MKTAELSSSPVMTYDRSRMRSAQFLSMSCLRYLDSRVERRELLDFASSGLCSFRVLPAGSSGDDCPLIVPYPLGEVMILREGLKFYSLMNHQTLWRCKMGIIASRKEKGKD